MNNYKLGDPNEVEKISLFKIIRPLYRFVIGSRLGITMAFILLLVNSITVIIAPFIIGDITNKFIPTGDKDGLLQSVVLVALIYIVGIVSSYYQIKVMGKVGQNILFRVRNAIFNKIQSLPLEFFNLNKSGDLISRINNDSEKLNQAFSETLLRFAGDIVVIIGIGIAMFLINSTLGLIAVAALVLMLVITSLLSGWIKNRNDNNLQKLGELSAEIQESLANFRVTIVFNRRNYFKESFNVVNTNNQKAATWAGIANGLLAPIYNYAGSIASLFILVFGIQILIFDKVSVGAMPEFGTLITFILYSNSFFQPLRELGELFTQIQTGIASWTRISKILRLQNNLLIVESDQEAQTDTLMKFHNVSFGYNKEKMVLNKINIEIKKGKTYAFVGPTGGGKSTTASLIARLYDPTEGMINLNGKNIKSYSPSQLSKEIGFILQEPFLFTGSVGENIKYGNDDLAEMSNEELKIKMEELGLEKILERFNNGLDTEVSGSTQGISLGQKQLIAFLRIILRQPKLLILDEATANVDTITEGLLEEIIEKLPKDTSKVIIAHRLNTIQNADEIFFIANGKVQQTLSFEKAVEMINSTKSKS